MNTRYIGSDESFFLAQKAGQAVWEQALAAADKIKSSTIDFLDTALKNNERLMQLSAQNAAAKAAAASSANAAGLAALADAGLEYLALRQKKELEKAKLQEELAKQEREKLLKANFEKATMELGQLIQDYFDSGAFFRDIDTEKGPITGPQSFRDAALKALTNVGELDPQDKIKLLNKINEITESTSQQRLRKLENKVEQEQARRADVVAAGLEIKLGLLFANLKQAGNAQQAQPWLDQITNEIKNFMATETTLPEEEKLRVASQILRRASAAYDIKAEKFAKYNADLINFQKFAEEYNRALLEFRLPVSRDYNNLDVFKAKVALAKAKYGDWSQDVVKINEAERLANETIELQLQQQKIQEEAIRNAGKQFPFSNAFSIFVAANAISDPFFAERLLASPYATNPAIKNGLWLAEEYKKWEKERAELQVDLAKSNIEYYRMDLRRADAMAAVINKLAERSTANELSPADQEFLSLLQQNAPELFAIYQSKLQNPKAPIDTKALNDALNLENTAITRVQQAILEKRAAQEAALIAKYSHLAQAGLLLERQQIAKLAETNRSRLQQELANAAKFLDEAKVRSVSPSPPLGIQPNFDGSSTFAPDVDGSGRVRVAPRARLQNIRVGNQVIISPVQAGAYAPITSPFGAPRPGNRRHAGVDFGVDGDEKAVALVSGVAYVGRASGYGNFIDIIGDNGYVYRYAHQQALVKTGQRVKAGEPISFSDGSGINIGGRHLHFEVRNRAEFDSKGNYIPSFGWDGVVDPIEHLKKLSINDSNILKPRSNGVFFARTHPWLKAAATAALTAHGAILANVFQMPGSPPRPANQVHNVQRPVSKGFMPFTRGATQTYDYNADYGYSILRNKPSWRKALVDAAKALKIPAEWLADIIQQETGWRINFRHGGRITGIIGFDDPTAGDKPFEQQVRMAVDYFKKTGWLDIVRRKGPNASVADFWILTRAGTVPLKRLGGKNMRQFIIDGGNPYELILNDTGTSFGYELELLGKWVGRRYQIPFSKKRNARINRNSAISMSYDPNCPVCNELLASGSWVAHRHDNPIA
jgi:murein DD-endopeptidase MepM/ murein hydrolase activator NlpD